MKIYTRAHSPGAAHNTHRIATMPLLSRRCRCAGVIMPIASYIDSYCFTTITIFLQYILFFFINYTNKKNMRYYSCFFSFSFWPRAVCAYTLLTTLRRIRIARARSMRPVTQRMGVATKRPALAETLSLSLGCYRLYSWVARASAQNSLLLHELLKLYKRFNRSVAHENSCYYYIYFILFFIIFINYTHTYTINTILTLYKLTD